MYLTTVQETANSSACNHIFNFQRRGPPRRRARKLLSLCHTHGSAPRNLICLAKYGSKENFGTRAELRNVLQEKLRGRGGSSCRFITAYKKKLRAMQHKWHLIGVRITNNICVQHQTLGSPSVEDIRESETFGAQRATPLEARLL